MEGMIKNNVPLVLLHLNMGFFSEEARGLKVFKYTAVV
jgi:hypothetical protein